MKTHAHRTVPSTPNRSRRGTIIILAVGILAVLAVASLSYMTVVRLDRSSAAAYATDANFKQQVGAVSSHLRALIGADLFGNKVVTGSVPERLGGDTIWPRMFEGGEYWDYPSVSSDWLENPSDPTRDPVMGDPADASWRIDIDTTGLQRFPSARRDDAWLASQTPVDTDADGFWDTWPQITNLRSGWYYVRVPGNVGYWQRDDGRYVDLAEWLTNSQGDAFSASLNRGDPGIDISRFDTNVYGTAYSEDNFSDIGANDPGTGGPNLGVDTAFAGGGALGTNLQVWEFQMSRLQAFLDGFTSDIDDPTLASPTNIDWRMWADTDGDGRADARWQELDALGELFGYRWVVAARIIDNSAMVSVNSSLEWQRPGNQDMVGMGRTPADIDLSRLLRRTIEADPIGHPDVLANSEITPPIIPEIWTHNLVSGWNLPQAFEDINTDYEAAHPGQWTDLPHDTSSPITSLTPLDAREREMFWRTVGSAPQRPQTLSAIPVPIGDEIDLRANFGYNYPAFTSKIEERLDQTEQGVGIPIGWLPGMDSPNGSTVDYPEESSLGPMRSKEDGRVVRTFGVDAATPEIEFTGNFIQDEKIRRIMSDIRRHMTTINGSSDASPIPVLDTAAYPTRYGNTKIRLDDPDRVREPVANAGDLVALKPRIKAFVDESFGAFMWALAPMLTNEPLATELVLSDTGMDALGIEYSYGGSPAAGSPAFAIDPTMGPAYAVLRALSLSVNLADALDNDTGMKESPTIVRFAPPQNTGGGPAMPPPVLDPGSRDFTPAASFTHGQLTADTFSMGTTEDHLGTPSNGVTLIGLDRQPFLMEAVTMAVLEDSRDPINGMMQAMVDPANVDDHVVSLMMFELGNPWPDPIDVSEYVIRISGSNTYDATTEFQIPLNVFDELSVPMPSAPSNAMIAPGSSKVFLIVFAQGESMLPAHFPTVRDEFLTELINVTLLGRGIDFATDTLARLDSAPTPSMIIPTGGAVPYASYIGNPNPRSVQLCYNDPSNDELYLVDRLSMTGATDFPYPESVTPAFPMYGLEPPGVGVQITGSGRAVFTSSLRRPKAQPLVGGGFPSYVVERPAANMVVPFVDQWDWELTPPPLHMEDPLITPGKTPQDIPAPGLSPTDLKTAADGPLTGMPSMQIFVPNGPLRSVAEVHMLSVFTHMFVHDNNGAYESDTMAPFNSLSNAHDATLTGPGSWRTISEQLGQDENWFYDGAAGDVNPYLGVLDPSRFVLGGDLAPMTPSSTEWPDFMRIPLALRVFDCFTVTPAPERLAQGKINLNTAPIEVLESMPFFAPEDDVDTSGPGGSGTLPDSLVAIGAMKSRANLVQQYRDLSGEFGPLTGPTLTRSINLVAGLRSYVDPITTTENRGLVSVGELLAMSDWVMNANGIPVGDGMAGTGVGGFDDFAQLGVDGAATDGAPLSLRYTQSAYGGANVSQDFNEFDPYGLRNDYADTTFDPQDDPEERLALVRSALDIASTRSDVFTAYFILRAYNPEQIEVIQTQGSTDPQLLAELLDEAALPIPSPGLSPVYESRWMGVFDRSQVSRPNERPRVLLLVELPID
jgi:hypothetical protein